MNLFETKTAVTNGAYDMRLADIYGGKAQAMSQRDRYSELLDEFVLRFGGNPHGIRLFSSPGRTEIGGNHTDHNHGKVLAASIDLDTIAAVLPKEDALITVCSKGYEAVKVELNDLEPKENEKGHSHSLVRGICARFKQLGANIGGFDAATTSRVLSGSGLSSSAAFEMLICTILNEVYNKGRFTPVELAKISKYTENEYFGKPCGLMDQTACAVGGIISIDFKDTENPEITNISFEFESTDHVLCIVDTGGSHADLTDDYSSIAGEMRAVAAAMGGEVLRDIPFSRFLDNISELRVKTGDRAVERAMHFYRENERVDREVTALNIGDFDKFKKYFQQSGNSSFMYNQNVFTLRNPAQQPLALALAMSENLLSESGGVWRVHGGGFAGTIQCIMPKKELHRYITSMRSVFGEKSCYILSIRADGACEI